MTDNADYREQDGPCQFCGGTGIIGAESNPGRRYCPACHAGAMIDPEPPATHAADYQGQDAEYAWAWVDDDRLPHRGTYVVKRSGDGSVVCTTGPYKRHYEDAVKIASAMNAAQVWL